MKKTKQLMNGFQQICLKRKLKEIVIIFGLLQCLSFAQAQDTTPKNIGKINDVLNMLNGSSNQKVNAYKSISSGKDDLSFAIHVKKDVHDKTSYIGSINGESNSTIFFNLVNGKLDGKAVMPGKKSAYNYFTDSDGNVLVEEEDIHEVLCIDFAENAAAPVVSSQAPPSGSYVYNLQSFPSASATVLLDFDGQYVSGTYWNGGNPINAAPSDLSESEIVEVWKMISEDYSAFNLNITTSESVYQAAPVNRRMRCIFTPTNTAAPGTGGVAYLGSFTWDNETPCWVFNGGIKAGGEAGSHEIGHTMGLNHDGRTNPSEGYYAGQGNWAPIMGVGYYKDLVQWSKGEYNYADNTEDDIAIISSSSNGFGFRTDEAGNTNSAAKALAIATDGSVNASANSGIISERSDIDVYSFTTSGGTVSLNINPAASHPDLDILATLKNSAGATIASSNPAGLSASFNINLSSGTYYLYLDGTGAGDPATDGYSDYASIGQYSISGTVPVSIALRNPENPSYTVNGLDYFYYEGSWTSLPAFQNLTPVKTGVTGSFNLNPRNRNDQFGFNYTGYIEVPADGQYTFYTSSDDGSNLYIGNTLVVNNDGLHAVVEHSGTIGLKAGKHAISVNFFEQGGGEVLTVSYEGPGISKKEVPSSSLFRIEPLRNPENPSSVVNGLNYAYYEGSWNSLPDFSTLTSVKTGAVENFSISPKSRGDQFGFDFTGYIQIPTDGYYTFYTSSDDGSKLFIGNTLIVNNDGLHPEVEQSGTIGLKAGKHAIKVVFFEQGGGEVLKVSYSGPGLSKQLTPASSLYRIQENNGAEPTATITSPLNGQLFNQGVNLTIVAEASDSDGTVSKVEFYNGSSYLGSDDAAPYAWYAPNLASGTYSFKAIAYDNSGKQGVSSVVNIIVGSATGSAMLLSPHPFTDETKVSMTHGENIKTIKVYDIQGMEVFKMESVEANEVNFGQDLKQGMYIIHLETSSGTFIRSFIKVR